MHMSTIICADHTTNPAVPKNMTNYTDSKMRINNAYCKAYSGRMLRHNAVLKPARHSVAWISVRHSVAWISVRSPMMELVFEEVHQKYIAG